MNEDHFGTIIAALKAQHGINDKTAKMVLLTIGGYYLRAKSQLYFIKVSKACHSSKEYKDELVALVKLYK